MNRMLGISVAAGVSLLMLTARVSTREQAAPAPQQREAAWDRVLGRAANGSLRVIVGLAQPVVPEGDLGNATAIAKQRAGIATAQDLVLASIPRRLTDTVTRFTTIPFMALDADAATLTALRSSPAVTTIQEDIAVPPTLATSVPFIGAPASWTAGYTGAGWSVAILDTGVDKTHPFLAGKVISEACYSTSTVQPTFTSFSLCPGGVAASTAAGSGVNCSGADGCDHGTHVAGIAAGRSAPFSGVAKDASVIAMQVFSFFPATNDVRSFTSNQIQAMERVMTLAATIPIAAVNMSLGGGRYSNQATCDADNSAEKAIIDQLRSVNIATVIASGNDGFSDSMAAPGCISSAVSVGSVTDGAQGTTPDLVSDFSNSVSFLSLLAPGELINSSIPGGGFAVFNGTSMAAPHVAGTWALMRSANIATTVTQVLSALKTTGQPVFEPFGGVTTSRIRVNLATAVIGKPTAFDFNADHAADVAVYRSSTGQWFVPGVVNGTLWGNPALSDIPAPADYNGDRRTDVAVYRPSTGIWYVLGQAGIAWGVQSAGDIPVPADYNGDRIADIAVYRGSTGQWFIRGIGTVTWGNPPSNDAPVAADYDGDGKADVAVYRRSTGQWFVALSSGGFKSASWGDPTQNDVPVPADYDGDGKADFAVYRPAAGAWFILFAAGGTQTVQWGVQSAGDVPVPADYNADGRADIAVYRASTGTWFIRGFTTVPWGDPTRGDIPAR